MEICHLSKRERAAEWNLRAVLYRMWNPMVTSGSISGIFLYLLRGLDLFIWQFFSYRVLPAGTPILYQKEKHWTFSLPAAFNPIPCPLSTPSSFVQFLHLILFSPHLSMLLLICNCPASLHYPSSFISISFLCFFLHNPPIWLSMNLLI